MESHNKKYKTKNFTFYTKYNLKSLICSILFVTIFSFVSFSQSFFSLEKNVLCFDFGGEDNKIYTAVRVDHTQTFQLEVIDPNSGLTEYILPLDFTPVSLKISPNQEYLYLSFRDTSVVRRYQLPSLDWIKDINLPTNDWDDLFYADDIEVFNGNSEAFIAVLHDFTGSPSDKGVVVINDEEITDIYWDNIFNAIEISFDDSKMFGFNRFSTNEVVSSFNISNYELINLEQYFDLIDPSTGNSEMNMKYFNEKLYFDHGAIIDVTLTPFEITQTYPIVGNSTSRNKNSISSFNSKIYTAASNFFTASPFVLLLDPSDLSSIDTIFLDINELDIISTHSVLDIDARNDCEGAFIMPLKELNINTPGRFGRLVVYNPNQIITTEYICEGDSILFDGSYLKLSGIYLEFADSTNSCDSVYRLKLNVLPNETYVEDSMCENEILFLHGDTITESGVYSYLLQNHLGCDSLVVYDIEEFETVNSSLDTFAMFGEYFMFTTFIYSDTTLYFTWPSSNGCDSIVEINVSLLVASDFISDDLIIGIYPNPFNKTVFIDKQKESCDLLLNIYSLSGALILSKEIKSNVEVINTTFFEKGVYIVKIVYDHKVYYKKIIKN